MRRRWRITSKILNVQKYFCNEYNLSFHHPKKDTCETCNKFMEKKRTNAVTDILQNEHDAHIKRKELAREEKERDQQSSKSDESVYVSTSV